MNLLLDTAERTFWAFAAAFLGSLLASPVFTDLGIGWESALKLAAAAGVVRALTILAAVAANKDSGGSFLPKDVIEVKPDQP